MSADNFKINLNQNLWVLVVAFIALGASEYYRLCTLFWFGVVLSTISSISMIFTLVAYTFNYCKSKFSKEKSDN